MYLLDTCVLSEPWRPAPARSVERWLRGVDESTLSLSVMVLGELQKGIALLPSGKKKDRLGGGLELLRSRFDTRIWPITSAIAEMWGTLTVSAQRQGKTLHVVDGLLAATALVHNLTLVTRNVSDMAGTGIALLNPWVE